MMGTGAVGATLLGVAERSLSNRLLYLPDRRPTGVRGKMNVILVIIDTLRRDHLGAYGNDRMRTPTLDTLAEESLRFTRPYPGSPCPPSVPEGPYTRA